VSSCCAPLSLRRHFPGHWRRIRMPPWDDRQRPWAALLGYDVTSVVRVGPKSSHYPQVTPLGGAECTDVAGWEPLVGPRRTR
jgi:hypothetical protein